MAEACDSSTSDESCGPPTSRYGERAYYKAYLSHPVEMASIIEFLGKLHPWGRVQAWLPPRWKKGGEHLNPEVGRVELVLAGSAATFEYGVTDLQPSVGGRKKKRKAKTYHMYVLACGSRGRADVETSLAGWWLAQLAIVVGRHILIDQPDISVVAARHTAKNQKVNTVRLQELLGLNEAEALDVRGTSASSEPLSPSPPPPSGSSDVGLATHQVPSSSSEAATAPPWLPSDPSLPAPRHPAWKECVDVILQGVQQVESR